MTSKTNSKRAEVTEPESKQSEDPPNGVPENTENARYERGHRYTALETLVFETETCVLL